MEGTRGHRRLSRIRAATSARKAAAENLRRVTILIDSDVLIEVLRGRDAEILEKWTGLANSSDAVLCSPVSVAEVWHGARPREHTAIAKLLGALSCVPVDAQTGQRAGVYLREYHKSHGVEL